MAMPDGMVALLEQQMINRQHCYSGYVFAQEGSGGSLVGRVLCLITLITMVDDFLFGLFLTLRWVAKVIFEGYF